MTDGFFGENQTYGAVRKTCVKKNRNAVNENQKIISVMVNHVPGG
jgi:hypothetical protein